MLYRPFVFVFLLMAALLNQMACAQLSSSEQVVELGFVAAAAMYQINQKASIPYDGSANKASAKKQTIAIFDETRDEPDNYSSAHYGQVAHPGVPPGKLAEVLDINPENITKKPPEPVGDQPALIGKVGGLNIWVQDDVVVFQRLCNIREPGLKDDISPTLQKVMQQYHISRIKVKTGLIEFVSCYLQEAPALVYLPLDVFPQPVGIEPIDHNPGIYRVNRQTMNKLGVLLVAADKLENPVWTRALEEMPYNTEIGDGEEASDIVYELGGQLYSRDKFNDNLEKINEKEDRVELEYDEGILTVQIKHNKRNISW